ncbi:MAG: helix-turn-helix domain-containing protein [Rhizobiaceae bacterium]|nr:helix-turn-helix domain-containing protein [Rhizobiaceae bacterium]
MSLEQFGALFTPSVDKSTVLRWERGQIPPERAVEVERITGISRHELRPDIFGPAPSETGEAA